MSPHLSTLRDFLELARVGSRADHAFLVLEAHDEPIELISPPDAASQLPRDALAPGASVVDGYGLVTAAEIIGPSAEAGWLAIGHLSDRPDTTSTIELVDRVAQLVERQLDRDAEQERLDELSQLLRTNQEHLHNAREELAISNQELEQFAYIAAHELVAPLRAVAVYAEVLESLTPFDDHDAGGARDCVNEIRSGVQHMTRQVQSLLDLSTNRLDADALVPVEVGSVVQAALDGLAPTLEALDASVEVGPLPTVLATAIPLQSVFANLLTNAIRYRVPEQQLRITVSSVPRASGVRIEVADNSSGIAEADRARVFQMFERASTTESGTGIGLALSRRILSTFGAAIAVRPGTTEGSVFMLDFPDLAGPAY
jgi:signal transduction histidine kinase